MTLMKERGDLSCRADAKWGYLAAKKIDVDQLSHNSATPPPTWNIRGAGELLKNSRAN